MQLIIFILFHASLLFMISISFSLIYSTTKFFDLQYAIIITLGGYFFFLFYNTTKMSIYYSILLALIFSICIALIIHVFIYKNLKKRKISSLKMLIASLGIYIVLQNIISIVWGDTVKSMNIIGIKDNHEFIGVYITNIQIITIVFGIFVFFAFELLLNKTNIGKKIKALSINEELTNIFGIDSDNVIFISVFIASLIAASAGILFGFDIGLTPTMGFNLFLYGIVAMIIGGVGSTIGLLGGSILLSTAQYLAVYYIGSQWMDAIAYIILILFLVWKPLGFSGKRLKKVEI